MKPDVVMTSGFSLLVLANEETADYLQNTKNMFTFAYYETE